MMNIRNKQNLLLTLAFVNFTFIIKAQQIDKLTVPENGITMRFDQILDTISVTNQGPWDYSKIQPTGSYEMSVLPVKESKNAADYPEATHVLKSENGEFFWDYGKDGWYALGKVTDNVEVTYEPGLQIFSYPFDNTLKQSKDIKTTHFFVPSKTEEPWQDKIEVEGVSFSSLALPDGEKYSDVLLVRGKRTTIQGPHSILGVTLKLEEYFEQFWLGAYPLPIMENYYVISNGTKLEFKRTLFLSKKAMNTFETPPTKIVMYPNPADNIVYLSDKTELVLVYDNKGSIVLKCSETDRIDISKIKNGFYTVKLSNGMYQCTQKLFKY